MKFVKRIISGLFVYSTVRLLMGIFSNKFNETYAIVAMISLTVLICAWFVSDIRKTVNAKKTKTNNMYKRRKY